MPVNANDPAGIEKSSIGEPPVAPEGCVAAEQPNVVTLDDKNVPAQQNCLLDATGITFIINLGEITDAAEVELLAGQELRLATVPESTEITATLELFGGFSHHVVRHTWTHQSTRTEGLEEKTQPKYYVIAFRGPNTVVADLQVTFAISPIELEIGFTVTQYGASSGTHWQAAHLSNALHRASLGRGFLVNIEAAGVAQIRDLHHRLWSGDDPRILPVRRVASEVAALKALPDSSRLSILGYFAALESILTHQPKPSDPYDSITRQIKKKLQLLDNRWPRPLDYAPFGTVDRGKLWGAMYAYRSAIAHGSEIDFKKGDLAVLQVARF